MAWRERETSARISAAQRALEVNPDCAAARILLSEEAAETVSDAESMLKKALKSAETAYRKSQALSHYGDPDCEVRND